MEFEDLLEAIQSLNTDDAFRARLDPAQWRALSAYVTPHEIRAGDLLIKQGDVDRQAYFLGRGTLQVYVSGATPGSNRIAILRAGAMVGEVGLISDGPRMANVEAMTPCVVWALRLQRFEELATEIPAVGFEVLRASAAVMAARMRANMTRQVPTA